MGTGIVNIKGKDYKTVNLRVQEFRALHPDWTVDTDIIVNDGKIILMKTKVFNELGRLVATGYAEETRGSSAINKTSAIMNCETSAIGRAMACLGLGGEEYCSANELENALEKQAEQNKVKVDTEQPKKTQKEVSESIDANNLLLPNERDELDKLFDKAGLDYILSKTSGKHSIGNYCKVVHNNDDFNKVTHKQYMTDMLILNHEPEWVNAFILLLEKFGNYEMPFEDRCKRMKIKYELKKGFLALSTEELQDLVKRS